jgi:hypothetical protein
MRLDSGFVEGRRATGGRPPLPMMLDGVAFAHLIPLKVSQLSAIGAERSSMDRCRHAACHGFQKSSSLIEAEWIEMNQDGIGGQKSAKRVGPSLVCRLPSVADLAQRLILSNGRSQARRISKGKIQALGNVFHSDLSIVFIGIFLSGPVNLALPQPRNWWAIWKSISNVNYLGSVLANSLSPTAKSSRRFATILQSSPKAHTMHSLMQT